MTETAVLLDAVGHTSVFFQRSVFYHLYCDYVAAEEIRCVFDDINDINDNFPYFSIKIYVVGAH